MLKGLYRYYLSPDSFVDQVFVVNAGESARGVRFILNDFKNLSDLKFRNVIKIKDEIFENEQVFFDKENAYVDVIFPCLNRGEYLTELAIIDGGKKLLSGIFSINYVESLIDVELDNLEKISATDLFESLINAENKIKELVEKTKGLDKVVDKSYIHNQQVASDTWTVQHNLGKYPAVSVADTGNNEVYGDVRHINENTVELKFSHPFSGVAFFN